MASLLFFWLIPLYFPYLILFLDVCVQSAILLECLKFPLGDTVKAQPLHQFLGRASFEYKTMLYDLSNTKTQV